MQGLNFKFLYDIVNTFGDIYSASSKKLLIADVLGIIFRLYFIINVYFRDFVFYDIAFAGLGR